MSTLGTKLEVPRLPAHVIERTRLMQRLSGHDWRVCVMAAGPGTGKTTLAAQWLEEAAGAWLSLRTEIDQYECFWLHVLAALQRARPGAFDATEQLVIRSRADSASFVTQLLEDAAALRDPLTLVLEDFHVLRDPTVAASLTRVVEGLPPQMRVLITSRSDPVLPLPRWRARSWLVDIRQRDLEFDPDEVEDLLAALGEHRLTREEVIDLQVRTEGWGAALILTALSMSDGDESAVARGVNGSNRLIADLLTEEIIDQQPNDVHDLMLCSSIADDFDADLCDLLTGRSDSQTRLQALERETHFLVTVDEKGPTYRYHRLLRDLLCAELDRHHPGRSAALHRVAGRALEDRGEVVRAVGHYLACGDTDRAFELVFDRAFEWCGRCDPKELTGAAAWLAMFSANYIAANTSRMLKCAFALSLCWRWEEAQAWLDRAERALDADRRPHDEDVALVDVVRLQQFIGEGAAPAALECGKRALDQIEQGIDLGVAGELVRPNLASAYLLVDDPETADKTLSCPVHGAGMTTTVLVRGVHARIALRQGHVRAAAEQAELALAAAAAFDLSTHIASVNAQIALLGVLTDRDDLVSARRVVAQIKEISDRTPGLVYRIVSRLDEVRVAAAHGPEGAFSVIDDLRGLLHERDRPELCCFVDAIEARLHIDAGEVGKAEVLIGRLRSGSTTRHLLEARVHLARGSATEARQMLDCAPFTTLRDRLGAELLQVRACIVSGEDPERHLKRAVELAAPEHLVRVVLEEGEVIARLVRTAAEDLGLMEAGRFASALGAPPHQRHTRSPITVLTEREQAVLRFLPSRLTNEEISAECFISVNTVKAHLKAIYAKLGVSSRSAAIQRARMLGEL